MLLSFFGGVIMAQEGAMYAASIMLLAAIAGILILLLAVTRVTLFTYALHKIAARYIPQ